jgi:uncharacterized repeat protein (TIGR01451 family)
MKLGTRRGHRLLLTAVTALVYGGTIIGFALFGSSADTSPVPAKATGPVAASAVSSPALAAPGPARSVQPAAGSSRRSSTGTNGTPIVGRDYKHDVSPPLWSIPPVTTGDQPEMEANPSPLPPQPHQDAPDPVVQETPFPPNMPSPTLNFSGISYPGVNCNCAPPDPVGEVGATQYVQMVNKALQVFDKTNGASLLGPVGIGTLWAGFGGICETSGDGDPIVLYDQIDNRWVVSQFAGVGGNATDECIAVSTSSDATGSYNRYGFHLGSDFFDYPKLGVWPDAYYMSMHVFNASGTAFLGPQPYAFDRAAMIAGTTATFITPGITGGPSERTYLPSDLDGSTPPPLGAPNAFVQWPGGGTYRIFHFHVDFVTPANSTFTLFAAPAAAPFTALCPGTQNCVAQKGTPDSLDDLADRLMFRLAYRNFGTHESVVGNYTVESGEVAAVRWFELRNVTGGPVTVYQESTYQPDTPWRWMGSAAMDRDGNLALGFSASSYTINPQVRYAGRLAGEPLNILGQGEATLHAGAGSQLGSNNRWGDYSDLTVDPVDDCTFWYTNEYYDTTSSFNWRTRIGKFKFPSCGAPPAPILQIVKTPDAALVGPGSQLGFTVTLRNVGSVGATGLNITDNLPAGGGINWFVDAGNSDPGWSISGSPGTQSLVYAPTTLGANSSTKVHVVSSTTAASCGTYENSAGFTSDNGGPGNATASASVGTLHTALIQNFDSVIPPALPTGWAATQASGGSGLAQWVTSNSGSPTPSAETAPNAAYINDPRTAADRLLDSPVIPINTGSAQLTFRQNRNLATNGAVTVAWSGGVLEISINGGPFTDIVTAGGSFVLGGYNLTVLAAFGTPIPNRPAWSSNSNGFRTTTVNLPASAAGQNIQLRWRMGSNNNDGYTGWRVDNVKIIDGLDCEGPTAVAVASLTARRAAKGVLVRWRTTAAARFIGFDVFGQTGGVRKKLNRRSIRAIASAHTYAYLVKGTVGQPTRAYWIRAAGLDGSHSWYGPVRAQR